MWGSTGSWGVVIGTGLDLEAFMTDLDNLFELQNTLAAPSRERERLRKYSAADYQRLAIIGRRVFVLAITQVCLRLRVDNLLSLYNLHVSASVCSHGCRSYPSSACQHLCMLVQISLALRAISGGADCAMRTQHHPPLLFRKNARTG